MLLLKNRRDSEDPSVLRSLRRIRGLSLPLLLEWNITLFFVVLAFSCCVVGLSPSLFRSRVIHMPRGDLFSLSLSLSLFSLLMLVFGSDHGGHNDREDVCEFVGENDQTLPHSPSKIRGQGAERTRCELTLTLSHISLSHTRTPTRTLLPHIHTLSL